MDMTKNQTNFYPLGKNKDILVETFQNDDKIVSLLIPSYNPKTNTVDKDILLKDYIYKTISIEPTADETKSYICIETYIPEVESNAIKTIGIIINVFTHSSLIELTKEERAKYIPFGLAGTRIDMILDLVDRCVNGKRNVGIGKIRLRPRNPVAIYQPVNGYYGKSVEYLISDFNDIPLV